MTDTIVIEYWEGDDNKPKRPFSAVTYVEWTRNGKSYYGHADESQFNYGEDTPEGVDELLNPTGHWEHRGIPDDVRETLALLIAPSLRKNNEFPAAR